MARKKAFVAKENRPEPAPPNPDQPLGEFRVRDLEALLGRAGAQEPRRRAGSPKELED